MAITTTDAVYRDLLTQIKTIASIDDAFIYIAPQPVFTQDDAQFVQLIPGVPIALDPRSGTGAIEEQFQVAVWSRLFVDHAPQSTARISDSTLGILKIITEVRGKLIQYNGDPVTVPVQFIQGSVATENEENPGWVQMTDTYRLGYEIAWL